MTSRALVGSFAALLFVACGDGTSAPDSGGITSDSGGGDASSTVDGGPGEADGGPGDVDSGPGDVDSGPGDVDGGPPPGSPTCTITSPDDGTTQAYDDDFTFEATATDPEDGALSGASVVWTSDVSGMLGTGLTITTTLAPGDHTITCTATDSASLTGTDSIDVTSQSPVATINHPGDGETRPASMMIPFVGLGRDLEDGPLTGASLVWTSSIDGMIGTGGTFNRTLSAGTNVVTLTVTDSDGNTGTDSVTLTITP